MTWSIFEPAPWRSLALGLALALTPLASTAQTSAVDAIVSAHILPRFQSLAEKSSHLAEAAQTECVPSSGALRAAFGQAFDAWLAASHLRFGPTEVQDRAFALAFWPDSRGATPRSLTGLLASSDPAISSPTDYTEVSIAARGFYALEFLIYDEALSQFGDPSLQCQLILTITQDIATTSAAIWTDWRDSYARELLTPRADGPYRSQDEVMQELFKALSTGLEFTADTRLGRPLGTFDRPRPKRAESWRSGRSARHVALSLVSLQDLALGLAGEDAELADQLDRSFARAQSLLDQLDDPIFAGVSVPQSRIKVEVVQQAVGKIRDVVRDALGPTLGVAAGFNALDGD